MKKMMRSTFGRLFNKNWVMAATLCICGAIKRTRGQEFCVTRGLSLV
ncbi:MAG: hypothetical protein K6E15_04940 [Prevotella sp.]|nr:hypothetical protein [Prevotella sp.]